MYIDVHVYIVLQDDTFYCNSIQFSQEKCCMRNLEDTEDNANVLTVTNMVEEGIHRPMA